MKIEVTLWILANTNSTGRHDGFDLQVSKDRNLYYLPSGITRLHEWGHHLSTSSVRQEKRNVILLASLENQEAGLKLHNET